MASVQEDDMLLSTLAELSVPIPGPSKNVTARSLSRIWEFLAPKEMVLPFFGKGRSARWDNPGGEDDHVFSNFYSAEKQFKFTVPMEIWNIPRAPSRERSVQRTIWRHCAERQSCYAKRQQWGIRISTGFYA